MTKRKDPKDYKPRGGKRSRHMAPALTPEQAEAFREMYKTYFLWHCCDHFRVSRSTGWAVVNRHGAYKEMT